MSEPLPQDLRNQIARIARETIERLDDEQRRRRDLDPEVLFAKTWHEVSALRREFEKEGQHEIASRLIHALMRTLE